MSRAPHVAFANRVAPPAAGASGWMLHDLAGALRERGWTVTVVTSDRPRPEGLAARAAHGLAVSRRLAARLAGVGADVAVVMTDPPLLPLQIPRLARRSPVVLWSLDVYPEVATALGVVPAALLPAVAVPFRAARGRAAAVVAIGGHMAERLAGAARVETVPLWAPPSVGPRPRDPGAGFEVLYSGTLGRAHPPGGLLDAAARLADLPDVSFRVAARGVRLAEARRQSRALANVRFERPSDRLSLAEHLSQADAHVVLQDPATLGCLVPSKVYGAAASGRPVGFMGPAEGEAAAVARSTAGGGAFAIDDGAGLAEWVRALRRRPPGPPAAPPGLPTLDGAAEAWDRILRDVIA